MTLTRYFLGANTPQGFRSAYDALFDDPRIRQLLILKGGPGCGKSTLMRALAAEAEEMGLDREEILCSSDPDSLDGLIVPAAGLALVDGTAPHVVEPPLCGCGASYVNLGVCYQPAAAARRAPLLRRAKEKNAACYGPVYAALAAAAALERAMALALGEVEPVLEGCLETLAEPQPAPADAQGRVLRRFDRAVTPKGLLVQPPEATKVWQIRDDFGLSGAVLARLERRYVRLGYTVISAADPLAPDNPASLTVPALGLCYVRCSTLFPAPAPGLRVADLDGAVLAGQKPQVLDALRTLAELRNRTVDQAVVWLARAKRHHDTLERLYRPAVDFARVETIARDLRQRLRQAL